jgi:hypothetical protein
MKKKHLDALRQSPSNRFLGLIYYSKDDSRVIVPRGIKWMGWTINFAHPYAWPVLALCVLIALGPISIVTALGITTPVVTIATMVISIAILVAMAVYAASRAK